ncbi:MAG: hypothetical protein FXF47_05840 [Candidatus Mcinerneyibacterium aminivorans]|uniref:Nitroreductase domain-containing protein n=1 Tax=Candidatus Mcinerneyibacterium aminivorans TaxID=2703815 RepID=A0A5D0MBJ2_9BACT|nr:MAG: hypothetical protein FXF47_05840 [Candidatus Mcinerneyibacterium aminivorans]
MENKVLETILNHRSVRNYKNKNIEKDKIERIVKAGRQAPFVSQLYSILMTKKGDIPFKAPVLFTICVDFYKMKKIMKKRGWNPVTNDLSILIFGIQDAAYAAQNMVIAAESMGLGTCFLGMVPYKASKIKKEYSLPDKVFPLVGLVMGYPDEDFPVRPRYPVNFVLFEDKYPDLSEKMIENAMKKMDEGYLQQDYYKKLDAQISLNSNKEDTYDYSNYSWTEHISRKWGQWYPCPEKILNEMKKCGFDLNFKNKDGD